MKFSLLLSCTLALAGLVSMSASADVRIAQIQNGAVTTAGCYKNSIGGGGGTVAYRYTCPLGEAIISETVSGYNCTLQTHTSGYYTTGSCAYNGASYYSIYKVETTSTSAATSTSAPVTTSSSVSSIPSGSACTWNSQPSYGAPGTYVYTPIGACQHRYKVLNTSTGQVTYTM